MARSAPPDQDQHASRPETNGAAPIPPVSSIDPPPDTWGRRSVRYGRRLLATAALVAAGFLAWSYVFEPVLNHGEDTEAAAADPAEGQVAEPADPAPEPPPRPDTVPDRIPQWAWALNEWHSTPGEERGARPEGAPNPVPDWYWDWREWRAELAAQAET